MQVDEGGRYGATVKKSVREGMVNTKVLKDDDKRLKHSSFYYSLI